MLYALGSNGCGQLGVGHCADLYRPEPISSDSQSRWTVKQFAAGGNHVVIVCSDGKVRATGNNEDGRCGFEGLKQTSQFIEVPLPIDRSTGQPTHPLQVSACWSSTTLLCSDGHLYVSGSGNSGELALGPDISLAASLRRIPDFPPAGTTILSITSGMAHTVAILSNGEAYGWGKGRKGQLGETHHDVWQPRRVMALGFRAAKAACGKDFTIVVSESTVGRLALLGPNSNDRFGIRPGAPDTLAGWRSIDATWGSIYALDIDGGVVAWGRDDHGQLPRKDLPKIQSIAAGSEHCIALTKAGKVLAWGWGEHGNCATPTQTNGDVKGTWNEIEMPGRVYAIFAGCATSFIETEENEDALQAG